MFVFSQIRCVDELETQLSKHANFKKLYFYHQHLTAVSLTLLTCNWFAKLLFTLSVENYLMKLKLLNRSSGTLCLARRGAHSIAVHGLALQVVSQNVLPPLFQKR